jgi:lysophospholipase L1-like esterase
MKRRQALFAALTLVIAALLVLGLGELCVRAYFHDKQEYTLEMWKYARTMKRVAQDPHVAHEHVPSVAGHLMGVDVSINSHKLREREISFEKPAAVKRILMLGDSLTFGWGVESDRTTSRVLERELNAQRGSPGVEVINAGVGNYNTAMEVRYFLNEGQRYSPDFVILNYFINDAEPTPRYTGNFFNEHFQSWVFLSGRLDTLRRMLGKGQSWSEYYAELYGDGAAGWLQTQAAVKELGAWCHEHGVPCLIANQPELHALRDYPFAGINEKVARLASEAGLEYLDLLPSVREEPEESLWVTVPDPHPNAKACALFGKALAEYVRSRL